MLITDYKGKEIHLKCTHFRDGHKYPCHWTVGDYQPSVHHSYSYVLNLTSDLDGKMVYCGTNEKTKLANFTLRIYRKPKDKVLKPKDKVLYYIANFNFCLLKYRATKAYRRHQNQNHSWHRKCVG